VAIGNARNFVAFTASRLDGGMGPASSHLSDDWYHSFMVTPILPMASPLPAALIDDADPPSSTAKKLVCKPTCAEEQA